METTEPLTTLPPGLLGGRGPIFLDGSISLLRLCHQLLVGRKGGREGGLNREQRCDSRNTPTAANSFHPVTVFRCGLVKWSQAFWVIATSKRFAAILPASVSTGG